MRDFILFALLALLFSTVVAVGATVATALHDRAECQDSGGTFYVTSTVFGCHY